ncbi:MAG: hypothetical protein KGJ78_05165 [Alphaproteobacteria bacterium]|nr:hypothetical protein [Alphaproteobacteria bacterium]
MGKYDPLTVYLKGRAQAEVPLRFEEIAALIGSPLPPSAYSHRAWWANEATGHIHAEAWLEAGFEAAQVDMIRHRLVFRRLRRGMAEEPCQFEHQGRHPLIGALKGTFTIEPGGRACALETCETRLDGKADRIEPGLRNGLR